MTKPSMPTNTDPLEIRALTRLLADLAADFGDPKHVHLHFECGRVNIDIHMQRFEPIADDDEETE